MAVPVTGQLGTARPGLFGLGWPGRKSAPLSQPQLLQTGLFIGNGVSSGSVSLQTSVKLGDLIAVFLFGGDPNGLSWTVNDNLGNVYGPAIWIPGTITAIYYAFVTVPGVLTLSVAQTNINTLFIAVQEWSGMTGRTLAQTAFDIGGYVSDMDFAHGTFPVSQEDTLVLSMATTGDSGTIPINLGGHVNWQSDTGDVLTQSLLQNLGFGFNIFWNGMGVFSRYTSAPGVSETRIKESAVLTDSRDVSGLLTATFSKPLARPFGVTKQYAVRPLPGPIFGVTSGFTDLTIDLPYLPQIGEVVFALGDANNASGQSFTASDAYGNIYKPIIQDGSGATPTVAALYTVVAAVPTSGPFQLTVHASQLGGPGDGPLVGAAGYVLSGIANIQSAYTLGRTNVGGGLSNLFTSSLNVAANSIMLGFAGSELSEQFAFPITWNPTAGYTIQASWNQKQLQASQDVQRSRLGMAAIFDKTVLSSGLLDAEVITNTTGADSIILVTFTVVPLNLACPILTIATIGVSFSAFLQASGGAPPYTFAVTGGSLPPGLALTAATGEISGIPTAIGVYSYTITVTDSLGNTSTVTCQITVPRSPMLGAQTLRWQCPSPGRPGRWFPHLYADPVVTHYLVEPNAAYPNDQELFMLAGGAILVDGGDTDAGAPIIVIAEPGSIDAGDERAQKLYVDAMTEADQSGTISAQIRFNNSQQSGPTLILTPSGLRQQFLENIASLMDLSLYRNISVRYTWSGGPDGPRIYAFEPSGFVQPYLSTFFVTQFINLSFPGWKSARRLYPALISNAPVIYTIQTQDGRTYVTTIPSTGGQYRIVPLMVAHGCKDLSFAFQLDGQGVPFAFFPESFTNEFKEWIEPIYIDLAIFRT